MLNQGKDQQSLRQYTQYDLDKICSYCGQKSETCEVISCEKGEVVFCVECKKMIAGGY